MKRKVRETKKLLKLLDQKIEIPSVDKIFSVQKKFKFGLENIYSSVLARTFFDEYPDIKPRGGYFMSAYQPAGGCGNEEILKEIGPVYKTDAAALFHLVSNQLNGEEGPLLVDGCSNVFYMKPAYRRVLTCIWALFGDEWNFGALKSPFKRTWLWNKDHRIFVPEDLK